tara:strand:+ start:383 stop:991 length:609 start_codon:yes stop_codon:yes gene_type:complete
MKEFIQNLPVLNATELKIINKYVDTLDFNPNTVFGQEQSTRVVPSVRSSTGSWMREDVAATALLHEKLNNALLLYRDNLLKKDLVLNNWPLIGGNGTSSNREEIQVLEYTSEQRYNWHFDTCTDPRSSFYYRSTSIVLYLKDDFEGGATKFKMLPKKDFRPKAGRALFFPSNWCFTHCSTPVISGKKRVAVTWYYCQDQTVI